MGRGQFLEAVADDEDTAVPLRRARRPSHRQQDQRQRQDESRRASQPLPHRRVCSALGRCRRRAPLAVAGLALALALPACGSQSSAAPEPTTTQSARSAPPAAHAPAKTGAGRPAARGASATCTGGLDGFLAELEHLRRSLAIGVSYEQYVAELGTVRKSYQQVPVAELDLACVSGPAASAEESFDGYLAAANTWGDCVSEAGCETAALEPRLQREWRAAAKRLAAAKQELGAR